jgi:6,7-dimethyl-8-ribityllumazine synthase
MAKKTNANRRGGRTPLPPPPPPTAVIVSRYNPSVTGRMLEGARAEYEARGGKAGALAVYHAPGAYELPALALAAAESGRFGAVVALGCVIRGETRHDRYISDAVANGLMNAALATGVPCAFGVLTVDTARQARDRAGGKKGNKGAEAMSAALETAATLEAIRTGRPERDPRAGAPDKAAKKDARGGRKKAKARLGGVVNQAEASVSEGGR